MPQISEKNRVRLGKVKQYIKFILSIIILILLIESMGTLYGVLGFVGAIVIYSIVIIILRWNNFMAGIRQVETKAFGKPLDREYWVSTHIINSETENKEGGKDENKSDVGSKQQSGNTETQ